MIVRAVNQYSVFGGSVISKQVRSVKRKDREATAKHAKVKKRTIMYLIEELSQSHTE